LGLPPFVY